VAPPPLSAKAALFLDFDGTLAEIAHVPDAARLAPGMLEAVTAAFQRLSGRVALLSGRPIASLRQLVPLPSLAIAGVHGLERLHSDGRIEAPPPHPGIAAARNVLNALTAREPRLLLEDKGLSIGLHYRGAPWLRTQATEVVSRLAHHHGLEIQTGKMVLELRTPGADKGEALRAFMAAPPFAGHSPVFLGDDDTDEAAFRAAAALGGHGIRIGAGSPTAAAFHLPDVASVAAWLGAY
jgi:trehalose 6-phosphate phosphatase